MEGFQLKWCHYCANSANFAWLWLSMWFNIWICQFCLASSLWSSRGSILLSSVSSSLYLTHITKALLVITIMIIKPINAESQTDGCQIQKFFFPVLINWSDNRIHLGTIKKFIFLMLITPHPPHDHDHDYNHNHNHNRDYNHDHSDHDDQEP